MKPQIVRHGEVILKPISNIPKEAKLNKSESRLIVAHSETGHHHILETTDMSKIKVYSWNGETYLEVPEIAKLWHQKSGNDIHTEHVVVPSAYKVVLKKEFDYFAGIMRQVRD